MPRFIWHIFKTEGTAGLFKGWAARCLKVAPACAIMISSYEIGKKMAGGMNERKDMRDQNYNQFDDFSVSVLVDHPDTLDELSDLPNGVWPGKISLFVKVDTGYHRSGASPESKQLRDVLRKVQQRHSSFELVGFYSHMGSSYAASSSAEAVNYLTLETERLADAADVATNLYSFDGDARRFTLSLGATPTATAAQNLFDETPEMAEAMRRFERVKGRYNVELHAGVYPVLDLQQLATRARPAYSNHGFPYLSRENLALRVLVEVASLYPERGKPEALIAAGGLALGREPCKSYPGWAVVSGWTADVTSKTGPVYDIEDDKADKTGWIVGRISQEHGILTWEGPRENMRQLKIGEKLLLWPNHACIAGAGFGWYFVVDSDTNDSDIIRDVWLRWRGW
ncbi:hypothetical protein B0A49_01965 [Cryomyces minteri]|uniref:D-serine dehydratase-like domain-containing protein n=1 Tax=Cryomyces minteri TaxID=331657 RepID=A0A4U0X2V0_9PEZI|nr:hypothetical protein B0A49_04077 [Cryomyces minteri]TKA73013.1 hypothetical protein B0A49_01965 [Cryomyces minteri]